MTTKEPEKKNHTTLFVVPTNEQARRLNKYLPKGCMAIAPGSALAGSRWETMIILRSKTTWGPSVIAWKPEHEEQWFDEILSMRLKIGGEVL